MATTSLASQEAFEKMCAGKEKFPSQSSAAATLKFYRDEGLLQHASTMGIYECYFCKDFHLGH